MTPIRHRTFVELNDLYARVARVEVKAGRVSICALDEFELADRPENDSIQRLGELFASAPPDVSIVGLPNTRFHQAGGDEARAHATADAIRKHLHGSQADGCDAWRFALSATGDAPIGASGRAGRWISAVSRQNRGAASQRALETCRIDENTSCSDAFARHGAIRRILKVTGRSTEVYVLELGQDCSSLFVISSSGTELVREIDFTFTHVVDATAAAMNLRMRGAAAKLLANPRYDFTETSSRIARQLADRLAPMLDQVRSGRGRESAGIVLAGLPVRLGWIGRMVADLVSMPWWTPAASEWLEKAEIELDHELRPRSEASEWLSLFGVVEQDARDAKAQLSRWHDGASARNTPIPIETVRIEPVNTVDEGAADAAPEIATSADADGRTVSPVAESRKEESSTEDAACASVPTGKAEVRAAAEPPTMPRPVVEAPHTANESSPVSVVAAPEKRRTRAAGWILSAAALAVVATLATFYFREVNRQTAAAESARLAAESRAALDAAARVEAEHRAAAEAEARRIAEEQSALRIAEAERAGTLASEEALRREAEAKRLLAIRGAVRVTTEPAGATVAIGNYAPRTTPARVDDLRIGKYPVIVTLDGYEDHTSEVEITDNRAVDLGTIRLHKKAGTVSVTSIPAGVNFDLRPAGGGLFLAADETWQGTTPAEIQSIPPGDYVVTFLRDGWERVSQSIRVENRRGASADYRFVGAALRVNSSPAGASVALNGKAIGKTPLALTEIPPGETILVFELADHETTKVVRRAEAAELVDVEVELRALDRIYGPAELDSSPQAIAMMQPDLTGMPELAGRRVVIGFEVSPSGVPENAFVVEAPNADLGQRCLDAVGNWRFTPGLVRGRPVRTRVNLPFVIR
ncbi:hypothetical protein ASA1KI_30890 [Opitutales bacterium ASA1]|uniref:PEGA domain-containing protein n=1 Tax=Congregicoccus parvus TaxID=3081749 RepID=UPI002B2AADC9|nr:hypothetical protein ASA1KI_30890 [Opitutales bacterium ASA1]